MVNDLPGRGAHDQTMPSAATDAAPVRPVAVAGHEQAGSVLRRAAGIVPARFPLSSTFQVDRYMYQMN